MLESKQDKLNRELGIPGKPICRSCNKNKAATYKPDNFDVTTAITEIQLYDRAISLTDTSILFCIINGYDTVSKIRQALDNAYYNRTQDKKIIFGGRTEGNLRARLKVLSVAGLVVMNLSTTGRIPTYTITNLGIAIQNMFMVSIDLLNKACSDCITIKMQSIVKDLENRPGQSDEELSF